MNFFLNSRKFLEEKGRLEKAGWTRQAGQKAGWKRQAGKGRLERQGKGKERQGQERREANRTQAAVYFFARALRALRAHARALV